MNVPIFYLRRVYNISMLLEFCFKIYFIPNNITFIIRVRVNLYTPLFCRIFPTVYRMI
jgi:hypothetical protein